MQNARLMDLRSRCSQSAACRRISSGTSLHLSSMGGSIGFPPCALHVPDGETQVDCPGLTASMHDIACNHKTEY